MARPLLIDGTNITFEQVERLVDTAYEEGLQDGRLERPKCAQFHYPNYCTRQHYNGGPYYNPLTVWSGTTPSTGGPVGSTDTSVAYNNESTGVSQ